MKQPLLPDKRDAFCLFGMRLTCKRRVIRRRSVALQIWSVIDERKQVDYLTGKSAPVRGLLVAFSISREI